MIRVRTLTWITFSCALFLTAVSSRPSHAQLPTPYLSMSVRAYSPSGTCDDAPPPCEGASWVQTTGRYEFDMYRVDWAGMPSEAARFSLTWPESWSVVSAEVCAGALVSGDLGVPGTPLEFSFPDCPPAAAPFLRIVLDCPTPGSFFAGNSPKVKVCGLSTWEQEFLALQCDVGDWCGRLPFHGCDWCSQLHHAAAGFDTPSLALTLPPGGTWSRMLYLWGDLGPDCGGAPECGEGYGRCFGGLDPDAAWLTTTIFWPPGDGHQRIPYRLDVDAAGLPPGEYSGKVVSIPGCGWCVGNCMEVHLRVLDPADVEGFDSAGAIQLNGPFPNPSVERFECSIEVPTPTHALLQIFDVAGRRVAELLDRDLGAGTHDLSWNRSDSPLPAGAYVMRLDAGGVRRTRLLVLAR
jgi:hypothetical protein